MNTYSKLKKEVVKVNEKRPSLVQKSVGYFSPRKKTAFKSGLYEVEGCSGLFTRTELGSEERFFSVPQHMVVEIQAAYKLLQAAKATAAALRAVLVFNRSGVYTMLPNKAVFIEMLNSTNCQSRQTQESERFEFMGPGIGYKSTSYQIGTCVYSAKTSKKEFCALVNAHKEASRAAGVDWLSVYCS